ncbi:ATP phosphoribosyltransferase regulatory subunit [Helicobacter sp. MIT 14-3879]|uniref:ATP phosphoribosyltransferase regulatory subunit n=1 Tax=Helicobacter sp. MIT 14-3879 TaxID=2040649 RepID=UPI000E1F4FD8|nr:ATP phosphoribosyltransferase regulatory subunit [Helicobacter sp. MIT 14-3879]RDU65666.1 ATP phosphoribosyltransferase regulatory subunit [Helicobacter sp. MIT 14-3879]
MILGYEVPQGSKIYFSKDAKLKRDIEKMAVEIFYENGYEEIATPSFNFTNDDKILSKRKIIRISADDNNQMILRNDNTIDVIKIINRHLSKIDNKKWFYIQPSFSYPSKEVNQIGAECIDANGIDSILCTAVSIFLKLGLNPLLQVSNMNIPRLCAKESGFEIEIFSQMQVEKILNSNSYLKDLLYIQNKSSLESYILKAPSFIKYELQKLLDSASYCCYENTIFSPLYYPKLGYYDSLFFRMFNNNKDFLRGGKYEIDGVHSCGFAIYTNEVIEFMRQNYE